MVLTQACRTEYKLTHMYEYILTTSLLYTILKDEYKIKLTSVDTSIILNCLCEFILTTGSVVLTKALRTMSTKLFSQVWMHAVCKTVSMIMYSQIYCSHISLCRCKESIHLSHFYEFYRIISFFRSFKKLLIWWRCCHQTDVKLVILKHQQSSWNISRGRILSNNMTIKIWQGSNVRQTEAKWKFDLLW